MKLLDAIKTVSVDNIELIQDIIDVLNERRDIVEINEPMSDGAYYEKWEEKLSDLDNIIEELEDVIKNDDIDQKELSLKRARCDVIFHQFTYGGLKRLTI